jgi:hypothetical protein
MIVPLNKFDFLLVWSHRTDTHTLSAPTMAANLAPILLFLPCPGSVALFATKMVRLASLTPAAPEVPILEAHFPNDSPVDLMYQIHNLTRPDEGIQRCALKLFPFPI